MILKTHKGKKNDKVESIINSIEKISYTNHFINENLKENINLENSLSFLKNNLQSLNPSLCSNKPYKEIFDKNNIFWKFLFKYYKYKVYRKDELPSRFLKNYDVQEVWHFGYQNKTHYLLNGFNKIVGCLNLIFLSIYNDIPLFYLDTIEIGKYYRRLGLGSQLIKSIIEKEIREYKKFYIFLLVVNCEQDKLKFFSKLGFIPIKLRKTEIGTHCIMSYPFDENSETFCRRMFEYFNWREEKKEFISSDCKYAYNPNPTGLYWCAKKNIYVTGLEKQNCKFYHKDKEIFNEKKFFDFKEMLK